MMRDLKTSDDFKQFSDLLDHCFVQDKSQHYLDDFFVWKNAAGKKYLGVFSDSMELVASAAARTAVLKQGTDQIKVSLIGAVATDERFRGRGHASDLVQKLLEWSQAQGAQAAFLWGSEHSLYQKLGFELMGEQLRVSLALLEMQTSHNVRNVQQGWDQQIGDYLVLKRQEGLLVEHKDLDWIKAHKNVHWYWFGQGDEFAYCAVDRGIDLPGIIHEWGGNPQTLKKILSTLNQARTELQIIGPRTLMTEYGLTHPQMIVENLCLGHIYKNSRFIEQKEFWFWGLDSA